MFPKLPTSAALLSVSLLAGCATHPALMTREERLELARPHAAGVSAAPAHGQAAQHVALAPAVPRTGPSYAPATQAPPSGPSAAPSAAPYVAKSVAPSAAPAAYDGEERTVADTYWALRRFRDANVALATALSACESGLTPAHEERARRAFAVYQESATMSRMSAAVLALSLTSCSSISGQIRDLNAEERMIIERQTAYQEHRKSIIALVAALEQVKRDGGTAKSEQALQTARARYDQTDDKL
jgi:hypothetical protein